MTPGHGPMSMDGTARATGDNRGRNQHQFGKFRLRLSNDLLKGCADV